jgi:hypothetical protein
MTSAGLAPGLAAGFVADSSPVDRLDMPSGVYRGPRR